MIGKTLGHYHIEAKLGEGGMGVVYKARDTQLDRPVAVKVLPAGTLPDPDRQRRFVQEARAASALSHPNVAHIYEIGEAEGVHFIAMEFVEGQPLSQRIGHRPLETPEILDLATQIADALDEAHSKGVTHRDLKPANIMVTPRGQAKVLDFGLAKITSADPADGVTQTQTATGVILGTVQYMSPEQALGRKVDHRTDLFSFGVLLYEMTAGRPPFRGSTAPETIDQIAHAQPEAIARLNYAAPPELERIIRKCLEKDRDRRYQSARELAVDLRNLKRESESGAVAAPPPKRRLARLAAFAAIPLAALAAFLWLSAGQPIDSLAVLPFVNAGGDPNTEYLSDGITENLINSFSQLPKLRVVPRTLVFGYKGKEVDPRKVGRDLKVRAVLMGRVLQRGDSLNIQAELVDAEEVSQLWGRQFDRKLADIILVQEEIANQVSAELRLRPTGEEQRRLTRRYTADPEAHQLYLKGRYYWNRRTAQTLQRAVEQFQQAIDKDPGYALAWAGLADCYALYSNYGVLPPKESVPRAKQAAAKALEIDEALAEPHAALAYIKTQHEWDWPGAEREFQRSIELNPNYATARQWYGIYLEQMGRVEEAIAQTKRAQELEPLSLIVNSVLGRNLYFARQYDQAIELLRKTIEMDPNFARAHRYLGLAYEQKAMYGEAVAEFQTALSLSAGEPAVLGGLGHAYGAWGKRAEAQKVLGELMKSSQSRFVAAYDIAVVYLGLKDKDQAFTWLERAYEDRSHWLPYLGIDPRFDAVRTDPRYQDLRRRMGLPP